MTIPRPGRVLAGVPCAAALASAPAVDAARAASGTPVSPRGKTAAGARAALTRAHCEPGKTGQAYSATVTRGRVISQTPAPGAHRPDAAAVNVIVSRGRKP
jgi:beta-lactam-binding protein with PASTA domain